MKYVDQQQHVVKMLIRDRDAVIHQIPEQQGSTADQLGHHVASQSHCVCVMSVSGADQGLQAGAG